MRIFAHLSRVSFNMFDGCEASGKSVCLALGGAFSDRCVAVANAKPACDMLAVLLIIETRALHLINNNNLLRSTRVLGFANVLFMASAWLSARDAFATDAEYGSCCCDI